MGRGRPAILKDRKTTTVSLEGIQAEYILKKGIDLSKLVRDTIDVLMQSEETPVETLKRQKEELEKEKHEREIQINQLDKMIKEAEVAEANAEEEGRLLSIFEDEKRKCVSESKKMMQATATCTKDWLEYISEMCRFSTFDEAKTYISDVWLDDGVPDKKIKSFLRLN